MGYEQVAGMSPWEQAHHLAYLRTHPPLADVANLAAAQVCQTIVHYSPMRKGQTPSLDTFILKFTPRKRVKGAAIKAMWMGWVKKVTKKDRKPDGHEDSQPQQPSDAQHEQLHDGARPGQEAGR